MQKEFLPQKPFFVSWRFATVTILVTAVIAGASIWIASQSFPELSREVAFTKQVPKEKLAANLSFQQGEVEVKLAGQDFKKATTDMTLREGDSLKTQENSKVVLDLEDGSIVRLDQESEIILTKLTPSEIQIDQIKGVSYHRVHQGDLVYKVTSLEGTITASGTAFNVSTNTQENSFVVDTIESKVNVDVLKDEKVVKNTEVNEGKQCTVDFDESEDKLLKVNEISKENLYTDWYKWNREEDTKGSFKLGCLEDITPPELEIKTPQDGSTTDKNTVTVTGSTEKGAQVKINGQEVENKDGQFEKTVSLNEGTNNIEVIALDGANNKTIKTVKVIYQPQESKQEDQEEQKQDSGITLDGNAESDGIHLWWTAYQEECFKYYKIVRSETNPNLKYPDDGYIKYEANPSKTSYVDYTSIKDHSYYYRICVIKKSGVASNYITLAPYQEGSIEIICSNVIRVTAINSQPSVTIKLTGEAKSDGVHLSWTVEGNLPSGFKIVASEQTNPTYPEASYKQYLSSETRSYVWKGLPHKALHFRIGAYGEGDCYAYSNDITVTPIDENASPTKVTLSAQIKQDGVHLSWTKNNDSDFKYYKVVRSQTNPKPTYPKDEYIACLNRENLTFLDKEVTSSSSGTYYWSVCVVDTADQVTCSNVIAAKDGVIQ